MCSQQQKASSGLDFELPYNSKLLLLAAYIASRNRPGLERQLFDTGRGKKRRKNALASDRQVHSQSCLHQSGTSLIQATICMAMPAIYIHAYVPSSQM